MRCKYCVHTYANAKRIPVETITGIGKGEKGDWGEGESKYDIFDSL
jgi:hypothetical protein